MSIKFFRHDRISQLLKRFGQKVCTLFLIIHLYCISILLSSLFFHPYINLIILIQAKLRENWLEDKLKLMASEKNIQHIKIQEVDTNLKRLQGIETDVKAQVK